MSQLLLQRVAQGDAGAIEACLDRFGGLVWSLARRFLGNATEAEDAVQEVFIEIWKNAARYDASVASETTFITMIARRRLIDRRRRQSRRIESEVVPLDDSPVPDPNPSRLQVPEINDEARRAQAAVTQLSTQEQKILNLAIYEGWTHQLIADRLSMPIGTVKTRLRRGLIRVRELLDDSASTGVRHES